MSAVKPGTTKPKTPILIEVEPVLDADVLRKAEMIIQIISYVTILYSTVAAVNHHLSDREDSPFFIV